MIKKATQNMKSKAIWGIGVMMLIFFVGCSSKDIPVGTQDSTQLADVTIMYYAHGGGNLDEVYVSKIRQMYQAEKSCYKNVKMV